MTDNQPKTNPTDPEQAGSSDDERPTEVYKNEDKKIYNHQKFETVCALFWRLLQKNENQAISYNEYQNLMMRIHKALLPLCRIDEMEIETKDEWIMDARGNDSMKYGLFVKLLFRIAHWWVVDVDLDAYIDFLDVLFQRVTCKFLVKDGQRTKILPKIEVGFPLNEKKVKDLGVDDQAAEQPEVWELCATDEDVKSGYDYKYEEDTENKQIKKFKKQKGQAVEEPRDDYEEPWDLCPSDESMKSDYEYKYEEDNENMQIKKYKREKAKGSAGDISAAIREPFIYEEKLIYFEGDNTHLNDPQNIIVTDWLDVSFIIPIGFVAEQFMTAVKNQVFKNSQNEKAEPEKKIEGKVITTEVKLIFDKSHSHLEEYLASSMITDSIFDTFQKQLRDCTEIVLRLYSPYPRINARMKSPSQLDDPNDPITEINKQGVNPALERRVFWEFIKLAGNTFSSYVNINYLHPHSEISLFINSNIKAIENQSFLIQKDITAQRREDEFINDTSYKKIRQIMLNKKFETLFQDRCKMEERDQKRMLKHQKKLKRKQKIEKQIGDSQRSINEQLIGDFEIPKVRRGRFYDLESKQGILVDPVVSDRDIIQSANLAALSILVIGKPRSGKTTTSKLLADSLDLVHINVERFVDALFKKISEYEAPDLEEGEEAPKWLSDLEEKVNLVMKLGNNFTDDIIFDILNNQIKSDEAQVKGYVLDLPFHTERKETWADSIKSGKLKVDESSFIIDLNMDDADIKLRAANMRISPEDGKEYSRWEREERLKPKPKKMKIDEDTGEEVEDDEEEEEEEDPENPKPKPFIEDQLVINPSNDDIFLLDLLAHYNNTENPGFQDLIVQLYNFQFIQLESSGLTPTQINETLVSRIQGQYNLRPIAKALEGEGDLKALLTQGLEDEKEQPRTWSIWGQVDPVLLFQGQVVIGQPDFAACYDNCVFVFQSEDTQKLFVLNPKIYLKTKPSMPKQFRILITGQKHAGKKTQAKKLADRYGWKVIDYISLVQQRIKEQQSDYMGGTHQVNNPLSGQKIGLSELEISDIQEGKTFSVDKFIPLIFQHLKMKLEKKRPPPPKPKEEGEDEEEEAPPVPVVVKKEEKKKPPVPVKQPSEKGSGDDEQEEEEQEPPLDDLNIDEIDLCVENEETLKRPFVGGFILIGFPETDEQLAKLKEVGIEFDKVLTLVDQNEENPGEEIKERNSSDVLFDYEADLENYTRIQGFLKEQLGEDIVKDIPLNGSEEDVFYKILPIIEPFFVQIDESVKMSAELGEEDRPITKGEYGDFCAVTLQNQSWMFPGLVDFEACVKGRTYRFAGEKELEEFKIDPMKYIYEGYTQPPQPHFMIIGARGSGVSTQIQMLCERYKLNEQEIKNNFLERLELYKHHRKRDRLNKRGFKAPPPQEEWEEEGVQPLDPEIEDDPEDFDRAAQEIKCLQEVMISDQPIVFDLNWFDLPEEAVTTQILDLLTEARRLPEIMVVINSSEQVMLDRILDRTTIENEYQSLVEKRNQEKKDQRDLDRQAKIDEMKEAEKTEEEIEEEMKEWEETKATEDEEDDPDAPNLENMLNEEKEKLVERRTKDVEMLEEFVEGIKAKNVPIITLNGDQNPQQIFRRFTHQIVNFVEKRQNTLERFQVQDIPNEDVSYFEKVYKPSKFGFNSSVHQSNPFKTREHALIFRDRIYYFSNQEEKNKFILDPHNYVVQEPVPLDVGYQNRIFILGGPKSGKSTMAQRLNEQIGIVHLKISDIIKSGYEEDSLLGDHLRKVLKHGGQVDDETLVNLVIKRTQLKDVVQNGFVLEGFPKNRYQGMLLIRKGIIPTTLFYLEITEEISLKRSESLADTKLGHERTIFRKRIEKFNHTIAEVLSLFEKNYENVVKIDSNKSKWFLESKGLQYMEKNIKARQEFARDFSKTEKSQAVSLPCKLEYLTLEKEIYRNNLSEFKYFCPVTWKNQKTLYSAKYDTNFVVFYQKVLFYLKSDEERQLFIKNPKRFTHNVQFPHDMIPWIMKPQKACEIVSQDKSLSSYCPVKLLETKGLLKGDPSLVTQSKELRYAFSSFESMYKFAQNPFKYQKAALPVKMPPPTDKVNLATLVDQTNSIPFLEQAVGQVITRGLMEIGEQRMKYPELSVRETALKFFSIFIKAYNPTNSPAIKHKYHKKLKDFVKRCKLPCEIYKLSEQIKKADEGTVPAFKENHYHELGAVYDKTLLVVDQEKREKFMNLIR